MAHRALKLFVAVLGLIALSAATTYNKFGPGGDLASVPATCPGGTSTYNCQHVTGTGGVPFAPSATTDTTNASNITSGTLAPARLSGTLAQFTIKAANTTRSNNASPTADPDLVYAGVAAGAHAIWCYLIETIPATQGIQVEIGVNAGFVSGTELYVTFSTAGTAGDNSSAGVTTTIPQVTPTGTMGAMLQAGFVTNASSTVSVAWAQSVSGAGATIMNAGSWCELI